MLQCILRTKRGCGLTKRGVVLNLAVLGGNFLRKYNVPEPGRWLLAGGWRLPLPLFGGSKCVKSMLKSIRTLRFGRCREVGRCWEGPLTEVPLYIHPKLTRYAWWDTVGHSLAFTGCDCYRCIAAITICSGPGLATRAFTGEHFRKIWILINYL